MLGIKEYKSMVKEAGTGAAPTAFQMYLKHAEKANIPNAVKLIQDIMSKNAGVQAKPAGLVESGAFTTPIKALKKEKLAEAVYEHVMGKMASESPEDVLSVIGLLQTGIDKMASDVEDVDSPEFIEKVITSLNNGTFFNLFEEKE